MTSLLLALTLAISGLLGSLAGAAESPAVETSDKPSKKQQPYCLLFGTVFDETGRLVRGAAIEVRAKEGSKEKKKRWESRTDIQGEFAVHLPAGKAVYTVEARAPGLEPDRKEVEFSADERVDVVLNLKRP